MGKSRSALVLAVIIVSAIGASVLGFWGFMETNPAAPDGSLHQKSVDVLANVWRTLSLFLGQSPPETGDSSLKIAIARVLALAATAGAVVEILAEFLGDRVNTLRGMFRRGHTVIVGCGERGLYFLGACRANKRNQTVVVDRRDDKAIRMRARDADALYFVGDARSDEVLVASGLPRAKRLLILCSSDAENLAVLAAAIKCQRKHADNLEILVGIDDPLLVRELNRDDNFARDDAYEATAFNIQEAAARDFLSKHPLVDQADLLAQARIHLACVGWSAFTFAVLAQLARLSPCTLTGRPAVSLLVHDEDAVRSELAALQPALFGVLNIEIFGLDKASNIPTKKQMSAVEQDSSAALTAILVSAGSDAASTSGALAIRDRGRHGSRWRAPIYVHVEKRGKLTELFEDRANSAAPGQRIVPVGFTEDVCCMDSNFGARDKLAQEIHQSYLQFKGIVDETPTSSRGQNDQKWALLRQTYRIACRRAADHLPMKLLGAGIYRTGEKLVASPGFTLASDDEELEALSEMEHRSWEIDRLFDGWQYGEIRDNDTRRHPALVPYSNLSEQVKDFDRDQIRAIASSLLETEGEPTVFRECRIGLFGHNKVSSSDKSLLLEKLERDVLPGVLKTHGDKFISVCTPLAPGADTILTEALLGALSRAGIPHRLVVARTLPIRTVVNRYLESYTDGDQWRSDTSPISFERDSADELIDFLNGIAESLPGSFIADMTAPGLSIADFESNADLRTRAFERGAAWLAERCDLLIAFCDSSRRHGRGGSWSTMQWAQGLTEIPEHATTVHSGRRRKKPRVYVI